MKRYMLFTLATVLSLAGFAQKTEKLLENLEYQWLKAEFKNDTATISKMMDDEFISIGTLRTSSKQQELAGIHEAISRRIKAGHIVDSLYFEDVQVKLHGNTAIVTFISVTRGRVQNVPFTARRFRMYDVWVQKNGVWKAVASSVTPAN